MKPLPTDTMPGGRIHHPHRKALPQKLDPAAAGGVSKISDVPLTLGSAAIQLPVCLDFNSCAAQETPKTALPPDPS
ncbi:hypothetical protein JZ751_020548 [Albula glossodonta]|uniref:Uncharacterized protein n=1 Tax=Albula glossodonta TaxID=121402 RepID=A0A8T2PHZ3_9TELE|nr:hypothetical protein JZ751_020548 [Albula glossodonta]